MKRIVLVLSILFLFNLNVFAEVQYDEFGNVVEREGEVITTEVEQNNELVEINFPEYNELFETEGTKFVFFSNYDCSECDIMRPFLKEIQQEQDFKFYHLNTYSLSEEEQEQIKTTTIAFQTIVTVPTIIAIKDNEAVKFVSGFQDKEAVETFIEDAKTEDVEEQEEESKLLLYIIIGLGVAIIFSIIGFVSTKLEEKKKNNVIEPKQ